MAQTCLTSLDYSRLAGYPWAILVLADWSLMDQADFGSTHHEPDASLASGQHT
jgi:hypothetical protein